MFLYELMLVIICVQSLPNLFPQNILLGSTWKLKCVVFYHYMVSFFISIIVLNIFSNNFFSLSFLKELIVNIILIKKKEKNTVKKIVHYFCTIYII